MTLFYEISKRETSGGAREEFVGNYQRLSFSIKDYYSEQGIISLYSLAVSLSLCNFHYY